MSAFRSESFTTTYIVRPALEFVGYAVAVFNRTSADMAAKSMTTPAEPDPFVAIAPVSIALLLHRKHFT